VPQETAERLLTTDSTNIRLHVDGIWRAPHRMICHGAIPKPLMRAMPVMESNKFLIDMIEVPQTKAHKVVQAFSLDGTNPRFSKRVSVGCPNRRSQSSYASILEHAIKRR